jgi:putative transposase
MAARARADREPQPSAGLIDSQSVKTTEAGGPLQLFADGGYQGAVAAAAAARERLQLEIVKRPAGRRGFEVLPRRWVIERSFAWLGRNRRLAKDYERLLEASTAMATLAIIQLLIRRLATP